MRIRVDTQAESFDLTVPVGARLLDYLQEASVPVNAACGGNATCHKCRVRVREGFLAPTPADRRAFRQDELDAGWRLSCQSRPRVNLEIELPAIENFKTKPRIVEFPKAIAGLSSDVRTQLEEFSLICDLGSTGVVVALAHAPSRSILLEAHLLNRQVRYGADVMTRLASAQKLGSEPLHRAILETIEVCLRGLEGVAEKYFLLSALLDAKSRGIAIAGNSSMTTFAMGWPIDTLAVAPFQPYSFDAGESKLSDGTRIFSLPLLAGFVGGDTVAGLLAVEVTVETEENPPKTWMLVDIGTNTEIVLSTKDSKSGEEVIWFSSAPAGPAFEGGNIANGMRAEPGAISKASYGADGWKFETIGGDRARGICGSGLIDAVDQAVRAGLISNDGFVPGGKLELTPTVALLADDIREFQLAKSATRSAIELLIDRAGAKPEKIYLAGTFAANLDLRSVYGVGLLPTGIPAEAIGNASLNGLNEFSAMTAEGRAAWISALLRKKRPVELALQDDFQDRFVRNLNF